MARTRQNRCGGVTDEDCRFAGCRRSISPRLGIAGLLLGAWLTVTPALADDCVRHDLGAFSLCAPSNWQRLSGAGTDSMVGQFVSGPDGVETAPLRVDYDFGIYSDPLRQFPSGATGVTEQTMQIDGLTARLVRFTVPASTVTASSTADATAPMHFVGLHVPEIQHTPMGFLKLTVIASSTDEAQLHQVDAVLTSIRFKRR